MKNVINYFKKNKKEVILITIIILLFSILSILVITNKTSNFDTMIHSHIINIRNQSLTKILIFIKILKRVIIINWE